MTSANSSEENTSSFSIFPKHLAVLVAIYHYQLLTNEQLRVALGYAEHSIEEVQRLTHALSANGYLLIIRRPVIFGRAAYVYALSGKGLRYLRKAGFDGRSYFRPSEEEERSYLFLAHTLTINDVLIAAARLQKLVQNYSLHSFIHERVLKRTPYKVSFMHEAKLQTTILVPDAYLDFRVISASGKEEKVPVLHELDRNTVERKSFQQDLRARIIFIREQGFKKLLDRPTVIFAYAVAKGGSKRLFELLDWSRKELALTAEPGWLSNLFLFTLLPEGRALDPRQLFLEPVWYRPFDEETPVALLRKEGQEV